MPFSDQSKPLYVRSRFIATGGLQLGFLYFFTHGGALGVGGQISDLVKEALFVIVPTVAVLILLPVFIRGTRLQKILAFFLSLLPVWFAIRGWSGIVVDHILI